MNNIDYFIDLPISALLTRLLSIEAGKDEYSSSSDRDDERENSDSGYNGFIYIISNVEKPRTKHKNRLYGHEKEKALCRSLRYNLLFSR